MSKKYSYPFSYPIDNDINIHIENIDGGISCIWFDNNNQEEQNIPTDFKLYNSENKVLNPYRNTQSFAIYRDGNYKIKYNNKTIILTAETLLCYPAEIINEIKVITSD